MMRRNRRVKATKLSSEQRSITDFFSKRDGPSAVEKSPPRRLRGAPPPHCGSSPPPTKRRLTYDVHPVELPRALDSCSLDLTALASLERAKAAEREEQSATSINSADKLSQTVIDVDNLPSPLLSPPEPRKPPASTPRKSRALPTPPPRRRSEVPIPPPRKRQVLPTPPPRKNKRKRETVCDDESSAPASSLEKSLDESPTPRLRRSKRRASRRIVKYKDDSCDEEEEDNQDDKFDREFKVQEDDSDVISL